RMALVTASAKNCCWTLLTPVLPVGVAGWLVRVTPWVMLLPDGWLRSPAALVGRPAVVSAVTMLAGSGMPVGVPVRSSMMTVVGVTKVPPLGLVCVTSWMAVGPSLPTAAVL